MTPEEKSLLERTYKLVEENNSILRGMRRSRRWGAAFKVIYWGFILAAGFGAYYVIQPYLISMLDLVGSMNKSASDISSSITQAQNAANSLKDLLK